MPAKRTNWGSCSIAGCENPSKTRGWCGKHYHRWQRHGDPLFTKTNMGTPIERFLACVPEGDPDDCWEWQGYVAVHGYGVLTDRGSDRYAHRVSWEHYMGPIPEGLQIDHLCFNRRCVNPNHLEPVTPLENKRREMARRGFLLPEARVIELYLNGLSTPEIGSVVGGDPGAIYRLLKRKGIPIRNKSEARLLHNRRKRESGGAAS